MAAPSETRTWMRRLGIALFFFWAALFLGGALGELLDLEGLRRATDVKRIFLR